MGISCNVTGIREGELFDYYINEDFGYKANHLRNESFSFTLCLDEHDKLIRSGREELNDNMNREDYSYQYGRWFTSEQIYDLISTFQKPPKGYYSHGWLQLEDDEEQQLWDHMEFDDIRECLHLFTEERQELIKKTLYIK